MLPQRSQGNVATTAEDNLQEGLVRAIVLHILLVNAALQNDAEAAMAANLRPLQVKALKDHGPTPA